MSAPQLALRAARLSFGGRPLFDDVSVGLARGDRACLVGRNGSGKSTLLRAMAGLVDLDHGERFLQPGIRVSYMPQEAEPASLAVATAAEFVAAGLPVAQRDESWRVEAVLNLVSLPPGRAMAELSGGEERRASLARALVGQPDLLLLDEPTNHLDLPAVEWLESYLANFAGGIALISHDRRLLQRLSRRTWWLDRGRLHQMDAGFAGFEDWSEGLLAAEAAEAERLDKRINVETGWLRTGVTARRRRNQGRLRALQEMRRERAARIAATGQVRLDSQAVPASGRLVIEARGIGKSYGERVIVRDFSTRILRGDRVGMIGPNGAGKTTLLRLLTGQLQPDVGEIQLGSNLVPAWFDQRRTSLDPELSLAETLCGADSDQVQVRGRTRHVAGYLREFLFSDAQLHTPVKALSGGERNRLLLARILAQPANLLVLDEPTNDLDMDTLDLLQEMLADYDGTLLLVSHDRDFLDRVVSSILAVEGGGRIGEYVGGYSDYERQRPPPAAAPPLRRPAPPANPGRSARQPSRRFGQREQRELAQLSRRIGELEAEIAALEARLAAPDAYAADPDGFAAAGTRLAAAQAELGQVEERWLELELQREAMGDGERP